MRRKTRQPALRLKNMLSLSIAIAILSLITQTRFKYLIQLPNHQTYKLERGCIWRKIETMMIKSRLFFDLFRLPYHAIQFGLHALVEFQFLQELLPLRNCFLLLLLRPFLLGNPHSARFLNPGRVLETDAVVRWHHVFSENHAVGIAANPRALGHSVDVSRLNYSRFTCNLLIIFSATVEESRCDALSW
jgi:hypothetical protein